MKHHSFLFVVIMPSRNNVCDADQFCYACGKLTAKRNLNKMSRTIQSRYNQYFYPLKMGDQEKSFAWRDPVSNPDDCYFCCYSKKGKYGKQKKRVMFHKRHAFLYLSLANSINIPRQQNHMKWILIATFQTFSQISWRQCFLVF